MVDGCGCSVQLSSVQLVVNNDHQDYMFSSRGLKHKPFICHSEGPHPKVNSFSLK